MKTIDIMFILCLALCAGIFFLGWITDKRIAARDELLRRTRLEAERASAEKTRAWELNKLAEFVKRYPDEVRKLLP